MRRKNVLKTLIFFEKLSLKSITAIDHMGIEHYLNTFVLKKAILHKLNLNYVFSESKYTR